jgi:hypothetical protein
MQVNYTIEHIEFQYYFYTKAEDFTMKKLKMARGVPLTFEEGYRFELL